MKSDLLDSLFRLFSYPNTFDVITPALCFLIGLTNLAQLCVKAGLFPASYMPCCLAAEAHIVADKYSYTHTTVLRPFFRDHPGEPVPEENFWTSWCRLTEADTSTIRLGATPSGLTSAPPPSPHIFLQAGCPSCRPTNSVKALKATSAFGLG